MRLVAAALLMLTGAVYSGLGEIVNAIRLAGKPAGDPPGNDMKTSGGILGLIGMVLFLVEYIVSLAKRDKGGTQQSRPDAPRQRIEPP
jgi:hypothetical protein